VEEQEADKIHKAMDGISKDNLMLVLLFLYYKAKHTFKRI